MKHFFIISFIMLLAVPYAAAQQNNRCPKEAMRERKNEFIKTELQLTETEEKALMPLLDAFEKENHAIHQRRRELMREFEKNHLNFTESQIKQMNAEIIDLYEQEAKLQNKYFEKYEEILSPVKIFLLFKAHHDFKRQLIREYRGRRGNPQGYKTIDTDSCLKPFPEITVACKKG